MGHNTQMDISMCFRRYPDCAHYGREGRDSPTIAARHYGQQDTQLLKCKVCSRSFTQCRGSPLVQPQG